MSQQNETLSSMTALLDYADPFAFACPCWMREDAVLGVNRNELPRFYKKLVLTYEVVCEHGKCNICELCHKCLYREGLHERNLHHE